jgi:CRP/FNR family cyclic AMP-dependent transcriptional regulator
MQDLLTGLMVDLTRHFGSARGLATLALTVLGALLVVAGSFVRTMMPLRALTALSNVALLAAAMLAPLPASVLLYLVLIPVNIYRLVEIVQLSRRVARASAEADLSGVWLKPYMRSHRLRAGTVLFRKGDSADALYLLVEGELELVEAGRRQPVGQLFGEISFFSPDHARTLTARCASDCLVLSIAAPEFTQLYFQDPKFAFQISRLITHRLGADIAQLREQVRTLESRQAPALQER